MSYKPTYDGADINIVLGHGYSHSVELVTISKTDSNGFSDEDDTDSDTDEA